MPDNKKIIITSVIPLSKDQTADIVSYVEQKLSKRFEAENIIDKSLLGGFTALAGDYFIDAGLKRKLNKIIQVI